MADQAEGHSGGAALVRPLAQPRLALLRTRPFALRGAGDAISDLTKALADEANVQRSDDSDED